MFSWIFDRKNKQSDASRRGRQNDHDPLPNPREGRPKLSIEPPLTTRDAAKEVTTVLDREKRERERAMRELLRKLPPGKRQD